MVTTVLILNGLIALVCLYAAWQVCRLRSTLAAIADALTTAERVTHRVLHGAPQAITTGQLGTAQMRQQYRLLTLQLQQVQQVLTLLGMGQLLWRQYQRNVLSPRSRRSDDLRSVADDVFDLEERLERKSQRRTSAKSSWMS